MTSQLDLKRIQQKAYRASIEDGLLELMVGAYLLLSILSAFQPGFSFIYAFAIIFGPPVLEKAKQRITYLRIGYVAHLKENNREIGRGILFFTLAVSVILALGLLLTGKIAQLKAWMQWIPLFIGMVITGGFFYMHEKSAAPRYHILSALSVAIGLTMSMIRWETGARLPGLVGYLLVMGLVLILWGGAMLVRFTLKYPIVEQEMTDDTI